MTSTVLASQIAAERARLAASGGIRIDLQLIADMWRRRRAVLDVGCGDGALLDYLVHFKQVDGRGIEISQAGVNASRQPAASRSSRATPTPTSTTIPTTPSTTWC